MKPSIQLSMNKVLKLSNVLIAHIDIAEKDINLGKLTLQMENYIKSKGVTPIGPLIQKSSFYIGEEDQIDIHFYLLRQANNFIHNVEAPYKMESVVRVPNCMYARYIGPEENLKFAYDKINVTAFEEGIELSNENYTIFVDQEEGNIVADVFVEKKENG